MTDLILYSLAFVGMAALLGAAFLFALEGLEHLLDWWDHRKDDNT
ncbi:hypothetical protein [Cellulosimicrobium cellulans]